MKRNFVLFLVLIGLMPLTTSCLGVRQINEMAIVTAVGLGIGEKPGTVRLSVQIIRPADARGQTGAPSGGTGEPIYSVSADGKTIFEAIRNLGQFSSRRVYWAHNFLIVMQEQYARNGITDMVDFFTRNHELRMNTWVAVTPDQPEELISTITGIEVVPGEAVDRLFRENDVVGQAPGTNMMRLEEAFLSRSTEPVLARLQLTPRGISNKKPEEHGSIKQVKLAGAAAFMEDKMVGWLSVKETRGLMFFIEDLQSGIEVVSCPNNSEKTASLEFKNASLKVTPSYRNKEPQFQIQLTTSADVVESGCGVSLKKIRQELEGKLGNRLQSEIESVLGKAQKQYGSDILKFGDVFRNKYPAEWRTLSQRWNSVFSEAVTTVQVKATIKNTVVKAPDGGVK
ncbi:Ger(x)C family spore germination protein [Paenibacillus sp. LHD-38]|uniref:Ger(x)C family spore germination protein n=1 Tax=Paenibacillus sp. LHD-38 TaxID=3072143 RepID=UPI0028105E38|nr:Ger(x)C family spore germination protein [Paenibacillus sp. LHD-38]MDQ8734944.1 Ger(x)C family spore germination protein [Paenibacillus sp. LHD-38]